MPTLNDLLREATIELHGQFCEKLRGQLNDMDKEWLVETLIHLVSQRPLFAGLSAMPSKARLTGADEHHRRERLALLTNMELNEQKLPEFIERYHVWNRDDLIAEGMLIEPPEQGTLLIGDQQRSADGNRFLREAKTVFYALLFGDDLLNVSFPRTHREILTLVLPEAKVGAFDFLQAATMLGGRGTWRDPKDVSHDQHASNVVLQIEYGETDDETIGNGILAALRIINLLEVNEQVLYARMENVEQSSLHQ